MAVPEPWVDMEALQAFEAGLNVRHPERSAIPARVLGYGEISTVLEASVEGLRHLALKRLPMFQDEAEAAAYEALHAEYVQTLREGAGVQVAPTTTVRLTIGSRVVVYILQEKFPPESLGHQLIHRLSPDAIVLLVQAILKEMQKVFTFNSDERAVGLDGQISNWVVRGATKETTQLNKQVELVYLDTSSPLLRKQGQEQLNPELFLRSAPSFLVWIIRLLFLQEVMSRYYDFRLVTTDMVANLYKEQRPDLIPLVVDTVNRFFAASGEGVQPLTVAEVRAYYREDAWIWRVYQGFRRVDRFLHRILGREYPYILPEGIRR